MSFRERIAWAAFATTVVTWGGFFATVLVWSQDRHAGSMALLQLFIAATVAQTAMIIAAAVFASWRSPDEARAAADERDHSVARRATGIAYAVMVAALVAVIVWLHFGLHGPDAVMALIGVFILAEAARFGAKAVGYRMAS